MHELGITQEVVAIACERAGGAPIKRIVLEIGKLSLVLPDAVRFCFELCSEDTLAAGAALEIVETPGLGRCRRCQNEVPMETPITACSCGSMELDWLRGEELKVKELEIL